MKIERFEDIIAWQKAKELSLEIYRIFKTNRDFSFRDQIQRAAISVMNNIAEGFERQTNKEMKCFFFIAKGSCAEVRSMLSVGHELGYIADADFEKLNTLAITTAKLLSGFIKTL